MQRKPLAVLRRDIIASTGPSIYGIKRNDKLISPNGEKFTFLGVSEGLAYLERDDKAKGEPIIQLESEELSRWKRS